MGHQLNIMSCLLERVAKNAIGNGIYCLQSVAGGPLCLTMLASQMNDKGTASHRTTIFAVNGDRLEAQLSGSVFQRYGTAFVSISCEEFQDLLIKHFSGYLLVQPIHPKHWVAFGRKLETTLQRSATKVRPSRAPETGMSHRHH